MEITSFLIVIIWAALINGFILGVFFLLSAKYKSLANKLLGLFLIAFLFEAFTDLFPYNTLGGYHIGYYFSLPEVKLLLPVLFLHYFLIKLGRLPSYHIFFRIHYIAIAGIFSITLINLFLWLFSDSSILEYFGAHRINTFYMSFQYYAFFVTVLAFIISLKELVHYKNLVSNEISDGILLNIKWLWQFIFMLIPIILFWGAELIRIFLGGRNQSELTVIAFIGISFLIYFVSYKAFTQQTLFDRTESKLKWKDIPPISYDHSKKPVDPKVFEAINNTMTEKELYLDQNLTIHDFAKHTGLSARLISSCINKGEGLNFNEWVNSFRVKKVMSELENSQSNHLSVEGIGIDCGFKSRSAMYAAFKKITGKSPGNYR